MRRVILAAIGTVTGLVALLSFKTHSTSAITAPPAAISGTGNQATGPAATPSASGSGSSVSSSSVSSGSAGSGSAAARTVTGDAADTMYGPVQVQITVKNGKITAAQAVVYPENSPRDEQINAYAIPVLNSETVAADGSGIDMISGATYTSNGYLASLQSALDKAGL